MAMFNNQMVHPFDARTLCVSAINLIEPIANLQQTKGSSKSILNPDKADQADQRL